MLMNKIYSLKKIIFITFILIATTTTDVLFAQAKPKTNPAGKTTAASKTTAGKPNPKNIKARAIIAADMDCAVKINGSAKIINAKAFAPSYAILNYGINQIEATSSDKTAGAVFRTTIDVKDSTRQIIEISFFDGNKFLDYVKEGKLEMVQMAIKKNPDIVNPDDQSITTSPLQTAITYSQPEVVKLLVSKGASFTKPENIYPLHKATLFASAQKEKGSDVAPDRAIVDFFLTKGCKLTDKDDAGNTLVHAACRAGKLDLLKYYLEKGLDINAKNAAGDSPLKIAEDKGAVSIITYLTEKGAIQEKTEEPKEDDGAAPEEKTEDK
jgi:Ankyrin repeats (many copies)